MANEQDEEYEDLMKQAEALGITKEEIEKELGSSSYGSPTSEKKDSNLQLFRDMIKAKESHKFTYLETEELGRVNLAVRHLFDIANYSEYEGLNDVSKYFSQKAEVIAATGMSRKGWFGNLIVTNIKKELKLGQAQPQKTGWFSKPTPPQEVV